jgi:hypothetical protein
MAYLHDMAKGCAHRGRFLRSSTEKVDMISVNQVLVISPGEEHHEKINAAMNKCGLGSICCKKFDEARIFISKHEFGVVFCHDILPDGDFPACSLQRNPFPLSCYHASPNGTITSLL